MSPRPLNPLELITRFIFQYWHFDQHKRVVLHSAFYPPRDRRVSVLRISNLLERTIWDKGRAIGRVAGRSMKARADIQAASVSEVGLSIDVGTGRTRHADIVGWEESLILEKATELALRSTLRLLE